MCVSINRKSLKLSVWCWCLVAGSMTSLALPSWAPWQWTPCLALWYARPCWSCASGQLHVLCLMLWPFDCFYSDWAWCGDIMCTKEGKSVASNGERHDRRQHWFRKWSMTKWYQKGCVATLIFLHYRNQLGLKFLKKKKKKKPFWGF